MILSVAYYYYNVHLSSIQNVLISSLWSRVMYFNLIFKPQVEDK